MTAKEKILFSITDEAEKKSREIIATAEKEAEYIIKSAELTAKSISENDLKTAKEKSLAVIKNGKSSAQLEKRNKILKFKTEAIETVLGDIPIKLNSYDDAEYFLMLSRLLDKNALDKEGIINLNQRDIARINHIFKKKIKSLGLKISENPADIDGGFILKYGGILINCSFKAMVNENREMLIDNINRILFS